MGVRHWKIYRVSLKSAHRARCCWSRDTSQKTFYFKRFHSGLKFRVVFPLLVVSQHRKRNSCWVFVDISYCRTLSCYTFRMPVVREDLYQHSGYHLGTACCLLLVLLFYKGCIVKHLTGPLAKVDWSFSYKAGTSCYVRCHIISE